MSQFSNTSDDHVMMFRCGHVRSSGCGKVLTEGQLERHGTCPKCGSRHFSPYYPQTKLQMYKCYVKLIATGEAWVSQKKQKHSRPTS